MPTKREEIAAAARIYGERSFDNYAQIRSVAENIRDGLCKYLDGCLLYTSPSPRDQRGSRMPSSA